MPQPKNLDPASMKEFYGAELRRRREDAGFSQSGLLMDPADPDLWFIIHEAALRMAVGGNQVMREQLERIAEVARSDQAIIQVMPFSAGPNLLLYGTTTLMTFTDEPPVVYTEGAYSGQLIEDPAVVASNTKSSDLARAAALSREASLAFVEGLLADYSS
ncbi:MULTISPECIES: DUF5753 domain-containing protein [unclassified Streptomyces]|uniref:DUF5753 domain-containing protein n=1 Tax=unclassified Streptomyces TaxID=2593676 RepID=UPI002366D161|nr:MULTISPECIES: DUF5753 domain-containing protein [unclassified Streptomyces]MDF3147770.1 DUF5753 domain-containing protein [Streptomyces sp. T21Q-yed]WDF41217.1 DUF5753 domain-containing protein [Streptomyces sp. T12]